MKASLYSLPVLCQNTKKCLSQVKVFIPVYDKGLAQQSLCVQTLRLPKEGLIPRWLLIDDL